MATLVKTASFVLQERRHFQDKYREQHRGEQSSDSLQLVLGSLENARTLFARM